MQVFIFFLLYYSSVSVTKILMNILSITDWKSALFTHHTNAAFQAKMKWFSKTCHNILEFVIIEVTLQLL